MTENPQTPGGGVPSRRPAEKSKPKKPRKPRKPRETPYDVFRRRAAKMHGNHQQRAKAHGHWLLYSLDELRAMVRKALDKGTCPYCQGALTPHNFSGDHKVPVSRQGSWELPNLVICCQDCNTAKGPLDHVEWRQLLQLLAEWSPAVRKHTLARLKAGARLVKAGQLNAAPPPEPAAQDRRATGPAGIDSDYDD